jgi:hypothetical protein
MLAFLLRPLVFCRTQQSGSSKEVRCVLSFTSAVYLSFMRHNFCREGASLKSSILLQNSTGVPVTNKQDCILGRQYASYICRHAKRLCV